MIWTDGSKSGNLVGFSTVIQNEEFTKGYKFKLHNSHSNNTVEMKIRKQKMHQEQGKNSLSVSEEGLRHNKWTHNQNPQCPC